MISPVPINFINLPLEEIDRGIIEALEHGALRAGAVKASIFLFSEDLKTVTGSYEWCEGKENNQPSLSQNISTDFFSGYFERWKNFEKIFISSPSELNTWPGTGFTSLVFIPVVLSGNLYGAIGFYGKSEKKWPDEVIELLEFMSSLIISVVERKKTEEKLRKSKERYRQVVELQSDLICHFLPDSTIIFVNKAMCNILNLRKEELTGKRIFDFESNEYKNQMIRNLSRITPENPVVSHEQNLLTVSGLSLWIHWVNIGVFDENGNILEYQGVGRDITERKKAEEELKKIEWMLEKVASFPGEISSYGDLTELNINGLILNSVGKEMLWDIVSDYMMLLETSSAVYEKNGSYAFGIFSSRWCKFLDSKSRSLCHTMDNREALDSGKWLCHSSCWMDASKIAIEKGEPVDIECNGGIRLYAVPILAGEEPVGAINFGYGDPPYDSDKLKEIAEKYHVTVEELLKESKKYESRPAFIIELAKKKLLSSARLIGEIVQGKRTEEALRESERKYKNLYHYAQVGLFETSLKEGKIIACNKLYCQMAGFASVEEAVNQDVLQFYVIPGQREEVKKILMEKGYVENYVAQLKNRLTGRKFWAEFSARVNPDRSVIEGTILDITEKKEAEETLAFTQFTMDNARDAVYIVSSEDRFVYVNHAACMYLGYSREELLSMGVRDIRPEYSEKWWALHWQKLKEKKSFIFESVNKRKDGTIFPVEVSANYIEFCGREYNCAFLRNITERKKREGEKNRLLAIIEATSDFVATAGPDRKVMYINRAGRELLKLLCNKNPELIEYSHPDWASDIVINRAIPSAIRDGIWRGETAILNSDGMEIPVSQVIMAHKSSDGTVEYLSTIMRDISERKKAEDNIAAEKERLSVTLRSIGDGVIATDISGMVTIMNGVAEKLTGWSLEEAKGKELSTVFHIVNEMTGEECENPVQKVLLTGTIVELANHTMLISRDGRKMIIADSGAPIKDKNSRIAGVVLVFRDMTERQKIMDHLQKTQKLDSLGLLAGGIAHDFNNLLGGIFGYIELARESCKDEQGSLFLSHALRVYDRAKSLTRQLLTFAKGGSPLKKTDKLTSIIKDTVHFALTGSSIKCIFNIDEHLWLCDFDGNQISQAIDNIVINALQAMPCGGEICVRAENVQSLPSIHIPHGTGKYVKISIMDHGVGIPKEFVKNIFDPFFTTKQKGSGLGLSIVYSIISKHDGFIDVESEQGKGTVFNIYLPASKQNIIDEPAEKHEEYTGKGTVLVMDDDEDLRIILHRMLNRIGYSTVLTANSREAISAFIEAEKTEPFSTVFLDMTIPGDMGGKEVIKKLLLIRPSLKALAISGYSEDPVMSEPKKFGFAAGLKKPFLKDEVSRVLNNLGI